MNISTRKRFATPVLGLAAMLALAGCQSNKMALDDSATLVTGSTEPASLKETAAAGQRWQKDPGNMKLGLAYAAQLKSLDQTAQQLEVLKVLADRNPEDQKFQVYYGKQLAEAGQAEAASAVLGRAVAAGSKDWKVLNAMGSTLDQQGKYAEARQYYDQALAAKPGEVGVLNNIGMSYALEGNLPKAEQTLREASALPAAAKVGRLRQNLALVVGLQGRFDEARKIASADLPPDQVEANMAYLQTMLSQPNTWQKLQPGSAG